MNKVNKGLIAALALAGAAAVSGQVSGQEAPRSASIGLEDKNTLDWSVLKKNGSLRAGQMQAQNTECEKSINYTFPIRVDFLGVNSNALEVYNASSKAYPKSLCFSVDYNGVGTMMIGYRGDVRMPSHVILDGKQYDAATEMPYLSQALFLWNTYAQLTNELNAPVNASWNAGTEKTGFKPRSGTFTFTLSPVGPNAEVGKLEVELATGYDSSEFVNMVHVWPSSETRRDATYFVDDLPSAKQYIINQLRK